MSRTATCTEAATVILSPTMTHPDVHRVIDAVWRIESARLIAGLARMEIKDPETEYDLARKINQFYELRSENFFMGNAIRGMLLNAYGWWLVGLVARIAGALLIGFGGFLGLLGFGRRRAR